MDEVVGTKTVHDIGPNVNNGAPKPNWVGVANGPTPVTGAVGGGALRFDGFNDYVEIPDHPSLNFGAGDFTADAWIKAPPTPSTRVILDKRVQLGSNFRGYHLYLANGKPGLQLANGNPPFANYTSSAVIADDSWHHIAVTVNRTGTTKEIRWYIDGKHVDTFPAPLAGVINNMAPLRLGVNSFQSGFLRASLADVELFNRVLTPAEIRDIYALGKCR